MPSSKNKQTSFLDLPAELRNDIYHLSLFCGTIIIGRQYHEPALLTTTLEIRAETLPIFYGVNTFTAPCVWFATQFMMDMPPEKLAMLRAFHAVSIAFSIKLQARELYGGVKEHRKNMRYIRDRVHRLVEVQGKGALQRNVVLVPVIPDLDRVGEKVEWVTLAELERLVLKEGLDAMTNVEA
ncbi:hypothetical protein LTR85_005220 [Meristemomyces frigidus]|nr:hypothetical protein LTR85_005220 [Meristemomyces frigidus]